MFHRTSLSCGRSILVSIASIVILNKEGMQLLLSEFKNELRKDIDNDIKTNFKTNVQEKRNNVNIYDLKEYNYENY